MSDSSSSGWKALMKCWKVVSRYSEEIKTLRAWSAQGQKREMAEQAARPAQRNVQSCAPYHCFAEVSSRVLRDKLTRSSRSMRQHFAAHLLFQSTGTGLPSRL